MRVLAAEVAYVTAEVSRDAAVAALGLDLAPVPVRNRDIGDAFRRIVAVDPATGVARCR